MPDKCILVRVHGRVQGVYFREYTRREAVRLGISGWVKNCPDGTVETMLRGEEGAVEAMLAWLHTGSPHAEVTGVVAEEHPETHQGEGFDVLF